MHPPECFCVGCEDRRHAAALWCRLVEAWNTNYGDGANPLTGFLGEVAGLVDEWQGMGGRTKELLADLARAEGQRSWVQEDGFVPPPAHMSPGPGNQAVDSAAKPNPGRET